MSNQSMNITEQIRTLLAPLIIPRFGYSFSELGLQIQVSQSDQILSLQLRANFPTLALQNSLLALISKTLEQAFPHLQIDLNLEYFIQAHRTQLPGKGLRGIKNVIAIASGKGGVGKSTVAINLASALVKAGARVGILDADIYGPSIPMMLGANEAVTISGEHYLPIHAHGLQAMSIGYLTDSEQALIWRGPMLAKSLLQMLDITLWDALDYLIIDLPPGTGDIQLSLVQKIPLTAAIVVTTPQNIATLDAQKAIKMFERTNIKVLGVIENMCLHLCSACGHADPIFGEGGAQILSEKFHIPLLGQLPLDSQIRRDSDRGQPTALQEDKALAELFLQIAVQASLVLAQCPLNYADKFPPIVVE